MNNNENHTPVPSASNTMSHQSALIYGTPAICEPLISIAIPTYRRPDLLREAIKSAVLQRSCSPYEVIIVDNDQSRDILDVTSSFPPCRVAVYQNPINLGTWGNLNRALELARGEWILFLCDDDLLMPDAVSAFERILSSSQGQDIGCLVGGVELLLPCTRRPILDIHQSYVRFPIASGVYPGKDEEMVRVTDDMRLLDIPKLCSAFFRGEYIRQIDGWDAECHGYVDVAMFLRVQKDGKLYACRELFGRFRVHQDNLSHPSQRWKTYSVHAAHRLLTHYADETTPLGKGIREMVEKGYTSALWKGRLTPRMRRTYAEELLRLIIEKPSRRFLLKNVWLLSILGRIYTELRPVLGWASRVIFGSMHRWSGKARGRGTLDPGAEDIPGRE